MIDSVTPGGGERIAFGNAIRENVGEAVVMMVSIEVMGTTVVEVVVGPGITSVTEDAGEDELRPVVAGTKVVKVLDGPTTITE